jgi:[ribosomal protein S18]-alanine N-acetyltransferase
MKLTIKPMSEDTARELISWRYADDYAMYNVQADDISAELAYFVDPENHYYAIFAHDEMVGHCVFYAEGRVPGGDYSADALDIGAGMRPDWTGQGKGTAIIATILDFAGEKYQSKAFRATIAAWNKRAQKATTNNGFIEVSRFQSDKTGAEFVIFIRDI